MAFNWNQDVFGGIGWTITPDPRTATGPYFFENSAGEWLAMDVADTGNAVRLVTKDKKSEIFVPISQCTFKKK